MIITRLIGGLGNQMFQYSAARRLADTHRTTLKLDISAFDNHGPRRYSLGAFNIKASIASRKDIASLKGRVNERLRGSVRRYLGLELAPSSYVREKSYSFDPHVLELPDNIYLDGYWQSDKYFLSIDNIIRRDFTIMLERSPLDDTLMHDIASSTSVSIHVRRGDYVSDPNTSHVHGTCDLDYYLRSTQLVKRAIGTPHFFIFSDEPSWAAKNIVLAGQATYVAHKGTSSDLRDLRLMSLCKHHIIANSTFSWWGAWLCRNESTFVVAPSKWFNGTDRVTRDLIPERWNLI